MKQLFLFLFVVIIMSACHRSHSTLAAPTHLTYTRIVDTAIRLSWTGNSQNISGYYIEKEEIGGPNTLLAQVAGNITTFTDTALKLGNTYVYKVCAYAGGTMSSFSNIITVSTLPVSVTDSSYVLSVIPATDAHNVLVEAFLGQSDPASPSARSLADSLQRVYPGSINVITYYADDNSSVTHPPAGAVYDFRNLTALLVESEVYQGGYTSSMGGVDRDTIHGISGIYLNPSNWASKVSNRMSATDQLNLSVAGIAGGGVATITTTITYTSAVSSPQYISIALVEDSIIDEQQMSLGIVDTAYLFNSVFRGMVSQNVGGDVILDTLPVKEGGRVLQKTYTYLLPRASPAINPAHCRLIAFVSMSGNSGDIHVLQSVQAKLMQ